MKQARHLLRSSLLVMALLGLSKILGFIKLVAITAQFGTGNQADAYIAGNQLPELFDALLAGGALAAALIPVYSGYLTTGARLQAVALANTVITLAMLIMGSISLVAALCALPLVQHVLAPQFSPSQQILTAALMRISLLATSIFSISIIVSSLLNAHQHFFTPALGALMFDVGQVLGVWFLGPRWGVYGLAWGSVLGALLALGVQAPVFMRLRIAVRPQLALRMAGLRELLRLMGPRIVTLGVVQAVDLVFIRLASGLPPGSIAAFGYAILLIVSMPRTLFGTAIATVVFPTLAEQYNAGEYSRLKKTMLQALQAVWAFAVPGAAGLLALGPAAVAFLLERGAFGAEATALVYSLLALLAIRLIGETTQDILVLPLFARHDTRSPMWVSLGWMVINVGLSYALVDVWGLHGLVWAGNIALLVALAGLYVFNRQALGSLGERALARSLGRILLATGGMCLVVVALCQLPLPIIPSLILSIGAGALAYTLLYFLLGGREVLALAAQALPGGRLPGWKERTTA